MIKFWMTSVGIKPFVTAVTVCKTPFAIVVINDDTMFPFKAFPRLLAIP